MAIYRVKEGRRFGAGKQYGAGDLVELNEDEAAAFVDLVEPVSEADADVVRVESDDAPAKPKAKK